MLVVVVVLVFLALFALAHDAGRVSRFTPVNVRGVLENLEYSKRTCAQLRRMYDPVIAYQTCDADASANLPDSLPEGARPSVLAKIRSTCREFGSIKDLAAAIDECTD